MAFQELTINYHTSDIVPPPYSFACSVVASPGKNELNISFSQNYTDRNELDEDEIQAEGFTLNDDFSWSGTLPQIWLSQLSDLVGKSTFKNAPVQDSDSAYIEISTKGPKTVDTGFPKNSADWDYAMNELIQAVLEAGGKENPFLLEYLEIQNGKSKLVKVEASFVLKKVNISTDKKGLTPWRWEILNEIFDLIYNQTDFISELALPNKPKNDGQFICSGDSLWYELGQGVIDVNPKSRAIKNIKTLFEDLYKKLS